MIPKEIRVEFISGGERVVILEGGWQLWGYYKTSIVVDSV